MNADKESPGPTEHLESSAARSSKHRWQKRWVIIALAIVTGVIGIALFLVLASDKKTTPRFTSVNGNRQISESDAIKAGKTLSHGRCEGEGVPYKLSSSPMKPEDFSIVIPYGLMVGAHVTPIDHQYFSPKDYHSKPDAYEVRAMADSRLVDISTRERPFGHEYRLVFAVSCTFLYYYDLVTSLSSDIEATYEKAGSQVVDIPVKAGQVIGRIGGQTLDFAVWDTTKPLSGFILPEHYQHESWKIFTADPLDYYTDDLKAFILSRYVRTAQPISGKIDHDIDGRLVGNWFLEGTEGYAGDQSNPHTYWTTHLSFSPDHFVPDWFMISIGDWEGKDGPGEQFITPANTPDPKDVSVESGLVKYDLAKWSYTKSDGSQWDQNSMASNIKLQPSQDRGGCAIVQMTDKRKIKFEGFPGKTCGNVAGFTSAAKTYTR